MNIVRVVSPPPGRVEPISKRGAGAPWRRPPRASWLIGCLIACCWSLAAQAQPIAPRDFTATAVDGAANLRWTASTNRAITRWEYRYRRGSDGWITWRQIVGAAWDHHVHTVGGLRNGHTYTIEVRAHDSNGPGPAASATVSLPATPNQATTISDAALRAALATALGKGAGEDITRADLASLTTFEATSAGIGDLTGLNHALNLTSLKLGDNHIVSLAPLAGLVRLEVLGLESNVIEDIAPLADLTRLKELLLPWNSVTGLGPLAAMRRLETLVLAGNGIVDISELRLMVSLKKLNLARNGIFDLRPLTPLTALQDLNLTQNEVREIGALVSNRGLGLDDRVDLRANPLNPDTVETHVRALRQRGVRVIYLPSMPERFEVVAGRGEATLRWALGAVTVESYELRHGPGMPPRFGEWTPIEGSGATTVSHTVTDLPTGGPYAFELRAVGLGGPGPAASATTSDIGAPNEAPQAVGEIADQALEPGERVEFRLKPYFTDADDETLRYQASSTSSAVAASIIGEDLLRVVGIRASAATVTATARDASGASASIEFLVSVGTAVTVADVTAAEGETAALQLRLTKPRAAPTVVPYSIAADDDPSTADADARDHDGVPGTITIAAGETAAELPIRIVDDDLIEPAQEVFLVRFQQTSAAAGYTLARQSATVTIAEGVCDRTPVFRDALRGQGACSAVSPATLAARPVLTLRRRGIATMRAGDLQGLRGLERLDLSENAIAALPPGSFADLVALRMFTATNNRLSTLTASALTGASALEVVNLGANRIASLPRGLFGAHPALRVLRLPENLLSGLPANTFTGLTELEEVDLSGNPGAPFTLAVSLARTDAAPVASGPATVAAVVEAGMPFAGNAEVRWEGGGPVALAFAVGARESSPFVVPASNRPVRLLLTPPALPDTRCGDLLVSCYRGLALAGSTLSLFQPPPRVVRAAPMVELIAADSTTFDLSTFFAATDGGQLFYSATSSNPALATARVMGGSLIIDAAEAGDEVRVEITATAADAAGQSVSLTFAVTVQPALRSFMRGWRQGLPTTQAAP